MGLVCKTLGLVGAGLLLACLLLAQSGLEVESAYEKQCIVSPQKVKRTKQSIAFLLGEDASGKQYFQLAEQHFLFDEEEQTDVLVKSCRSIEDVLYYINETADHVFWETIHIVVHGNPYNGLSVAIDNEGPRATPKNLIKATMNLSLPAIQTAAIDTNTQINFWACGIGKNPFIKIAMEHFFKLPNGRLPQLYVSSHFVLFEKSKNGYAPKRYNAKYWPYIFKRGYRPADWQIEKSLKQQYPTIDVDWMVAIQRSESGTNYSSFQNIFHIPVSWTVIYPSKQSRPSVRSKEDKMEWIRSQPALLQQIEEVNIPLDKFTWTVNKIIHTDEQGQKVPAIKAIGMATVLCVLEVEAAQYP